MYVHEIVYDGTCEVIYNKKRLVLLIVLALIDSIDLGVS